MRVPLAPYARRELCLIGLPLAGLAAALAWFQPWLMAAPLALLAFVLFFFRDPQRAIPEGDDLVLAPADGRVVEVTRVKGEDWLGADREAWKISIFLSLFNVHINRAPVAGRVAYRHYRPGVFRAAFKEEASERNECNAVGLESGGRQVLLKQIAGLVARRIVCRSEPGDYLQRGERFGMIKFGSRTEIFLPAASGFTPAVAVGQRVKAGLSVLGKYA